MPPRASNIPVTKFRVYRSPAGTHWAILRSSPNTYVFTRFGYMHPAMAVQRLMDNMNTNQVVRTNGANIQRWMNGIQLTTLQMMPMTPNAWARFQAANTLHNMRNPLMTLARAASI